MASVSETSVTVIGESVQVRGNLSGDEDLHVLGRIEGSLDLQRTLVVAESGVVKAEVSVRNAVVSGVVVGNIRARESVEITREGRMVGDISAPRIIIVDGASFRGNVDMGDATTEERRESMPARPRAERPTPTPVAVAVPRAAPRREEKKPERKVAPPAVTVAPPEERPEKGPIVVEPAAAGAGNGEEKAAAKVEPARAPPAARSTITPRPAPPPAPKKPPTFLNPPKAKGLPKKTQKSRVVVKRR